MHVTERTSFTNRNDVVSRVISSAMKKGRLSSDSSNNDCVCRYCKSQRVVPSAGQCGRRELSCRRNSCRKIYTGDEHWTKVHQAKDAATTRQSVSSYWSDQNDQQSSSDPWFPMSSSSSLTQRKLVSKASSAGIFHSLFTKLRDWVRTPRSVSPESPLFECPSSGGATEHSILDAGVKGRNPLQSIVPTCCDVVATDDECQLDSLSPVAMAAGLPLSLSCGHVHRVHDKTTVVNCAVQDHQPGHDQLFYATWPLWSSKYSAHANRSAKDQFLLSKHTESRSFKTSTADSCLHDVNMTSHSESVDDRLFDSLNADWSIPFDDLVIGQCIRSGNRRKVYRGRWHGDVLIYTYRQHSTDTDIREFLKDVAKLSRIRHENVCLFMGACLQPPNLSIVTSEVKGASLYEKLHVKSETSVSLRSRVNIARQVALAVGYLHARGVIVGKLDSRNVHLEPKVKLSLLDHGFTSDKTSCRPCYGYLRRGKLTYLAPETLRTMKLATGCRLQFSWPVTRETDVFAFGTLLYELLYEQFPFSQTPPETIVYLVCTGCHPALNYVNCRSTLKVLIEQCWSFKPADRPTFSDINKELQLKTGLHKRHSSSQPDRLNRINTSIKR